MAGQKLNQEQPLLSILRQGGAWTKAELSKKLGKSTRTIERYFEAIEQNGIRIEQEGKPLRYSVEIQESHLPQSSLPLTENDFGLLKTALEAAHVFFGETSYNKDMERIMRLLGESIDESLLEVDLDTYRDHWYFHAVAISHLHTDTLKLLSEAIWKRQRILADYFSVRSGETQSDVVLEPYSLAWINGSWLLAARYQGRDKMQDFSPADLSRLRIADPKHEKDHFDRDPNFSPEQFYRFRFGALSNENGDAYIVRIWVSPEKARAFRRKSLKPKMPTARLLFLSIVSIYSISKLFCSVGAAVFGFKNQKNLWT
jgi:predicted DNA-binding transcriptional regulator YafY